MNYLYILTIPIVFLCRAIYYQRRVSFLGSFSKLYMEYINSYIEKKETEENNPVYDKLTTKIQRQQEYVKKYILEAGIGNPHIASARPIGLGFADTSGAKALDNIAYLGNATIADNL